MKWKKFMSVGLAAAVVLSTVPASTTVFASSVQEAADSGSAALKGSEKASSEYGKVLTSEIAEDEASSTKPANGAVIKWTVYDSGTLVIENAEGGNGLTPNRAPWFEYKDKIKKIVLGDDITGLGDRAFAGYTGITEVDFEQPISQIGASTFEGCT